MHADAIIAAFEVEYTTVIYSALLRMSDFARMQPNIKIDLFMVAPDERRETLANEIHWPTFARLKPPLPQDLPVQPPLPSCGGGWSRSGAEFAI